MIHHHQHSSGESRNLLITVVLNFTISGAEIVGGIFSNSLSLISDAVHNLSDGLAVLITFVAVKISGRKSSAIKTFGYKRIQILAALFNAATLIAICFYLIYEAVGRFIQPEPVKSIPMFIVAAIGLLANLVGVFLLKGHATGNLNIKAAYLHLIGDTLSSVAVIVGGLMIYWLDWHWIDPLITLLISLYIIKETYAILQKTYEILMQATPKGLDIEQIKTRLENMKEICGLHHVHIWSLTDQEIHFEAHVDLCEDIKISESETLIENISKILAQEFNIGHTTLQFEHNFCDDKSLISQTYLKE